jgi:hypothetical protein
MRSFSSVEPVLRKSWIVNGSSGSLFSPAPPPDRRRD